MSKSIPAYLRLHAGSPQRDDATAAISIEPAARFWQAYTSATGWRVDRGHGSARHGVTANQRDDRSVTGPRLLPALGGGILADVSSVSEAPSVDRATAERLAEAASELIRQNERAAAVVRRLNAELAIAAIPAEPCDSDDRLADRLQQLLQRAITAIGCDCGALYMLDDDTTTLTLRASVGLTAAVPAGSNRSAATNRSTRPLRGSRGDLESLVRDVVMIDDLRHSPAAKWNSPEDFAAAIVVRVEDDDLPVGTLWLWSRRRRTFESHDGAAAALAAASIGGELARTKLSRKQKRWAASHQAIQHVAQWQMRQLPAAMEIASGYLVDGWTESPRPWACSWHSWDILPDGTIALAIAEAEQSGLDGAMIAATSRAAFAAHCHYRHSVTEMLTRISDSLWNTNTGDQIVSMLYSHLNPETGEGWVASAGSIEAIIAGKRGFRPLCSGSQGEPLASRIDCRLASTEFRIQPGEALVAVNRGVLDPVSGLTQSAWVESVREGLSRQDLPVLPSIRRALADRMAEPSVAKSQVGVPERAGLMLLRQS